MNEPVVQPKAVRAGADWWRGAIIYQVYPRSYQDSNGDGSGDLKGVTARLEHIAMLGVDAVWLSPFFKSPMEDMGYDVSDYCDVDPMFGTMKDFDDLLAEAHRLGLKVIIDQVLSHSSDRHEWFMESRADRENPKADWYIWAEPKPDGTPPNNWLSVFGGPAWEWDSVRRQYYMHNFLTSQPDLNFHNQQVQDALLGTVRFWLDRGVDGFRFDTVNYYFHDAQLRDNPPLPSGAVTDIPDTNPYGYQDHLFDKTQPDNIGFLRRLRALLDSYGARTSVGEVGDGPRSLQTVAAYTGAGDKLHMSYTFDLLSAEFSAVYVRKCIDAFENAVTDGWVCWAFSNHDVMRHVSRWTPAGGDPVRTAKFAIALLICLRGSICLYQGEELGLEEADLAFEDLRDPYGIRFWPGFKGRDGCRTPMVWDDTQPNSGFSLSKPWLPVPEEHRRKAVSVQERDPNSVLNAYRSFIAFRKEHPVLATGSIRFLSSDADMLAFLRRNSDDQVLCVFNFSAEDASWTPPEGLGRIEHVSFGQFGTDYAGGEVHLPPLSGFFAYLR